MNERFTTFRDGVRAGVPFALAGFVVAISFGVLATQVGLSPVAAIVMSMIVYAGSAQFAAIAILAGGGGVGSAVGAAAQTLMQRETPHSLPSRPPGSSHLA